MSLTKAQTNRSEPAEAADWPVAGFDSDLLSIDQLKAAGKVLSAGQVRAALGDGRVAVRANAVGVLGQLGPLQEPDLSLVLVMLRDASPSVRAAAVQCAAAASEVDKAVAALLKAAAADRRLLPEIEKVVATYGAKALPALTAALRTDAETADRLVLPALLALGEPAVLALANLLADGDPRLRANSLTGLMVLGPSIMAPYHRSIVALGRDGDIAVRKLAREALTMISRSGSPALAEARPLPFDDFAVQLGDEAALKKVAKQVEVEALLALTRDGRPMVRANAWRSLGSMAPLTPEAALNAGVAVRDSDVRVRIEAAAALRQCPESVLESAVAQLLLSVADPDRNVAHAVRQAVLGQGKRVLPLLVAQMGSRSAAVQEAARAMLVHFESDAAAVLRTALGASLPSIREGAALALGEIGGKTLDDAADLLLATLKDPLDSARAAAVRSLSRTSDRLQKQNYDTWLALARNLWQNDAALAVRNAAKDWADGLLLRR
ncbi:MAG: hypothetical protein HY902_02255 [Deltaproteobacteria bacterium]|nr:hypothetical protein [Deltaproteobacteria bacterium]